MEIWTNISGTTSSQFTIGKGGSTLHEGDDIPSNSLGQNGDLYFLRGETPGLYQKSNSTWKSISKVFIRQDVPQGSTETISATASYVGVTTGSVAPTALTLPNAVLGTTITIKDEVGNAQTHNITVTGSIDGASAYVISTNYGSVTLSHRDGDWFVVRRA